MRNEITRRSALIGAAGLSLAACGERRFDPRPAPEGPFKHGVASGDPDQTSLVVWTAVTDANGPVSVEIARDAGFTDPIGRFEMGAAGPATEGARPMKRLIDGLEPGAEIHYRMRAGEAVSPAGRARTLPAGPTERFRIAAFSCSNHPAGFFNAYADQARRGDADLLIHLGDYIYEYEMGGYATGDAERLGRVPEPPHELITYEDYARRHAQYCADPDLQALKASAPFLMIWDDHETANNAWREGAENHQPDSEGPWIERRQAALRAWSAWTPSRERDPAHERWGAVRIGDLATLLFLETRLSARDAEVLWDDFPVDPDTADPNDPAARAAVADWLRRTAGAPERRLIGERQLGEAAAALDASVRAGEPWRVVANQVIMGRVPAPDYTTVLPAWLRFLIRANDPLAWSYMKRFAFGTPFNLDAWDGYAAERERLYDAAKAAGADLITLTGDTHNFWAIDLTDADGRLMGSEFGVTSVTSPSRFERLQLPGVDFGRYTEETAPDVRRHNAYDRGYLRLTLTREAAEAEFVVVERIDRPGSPTRIDSRWRVSPAVDGRARPMERIA